MSHLTALVAGNFSNASKDYEEAISKGRGWKEAINEELKSLDKNNTWEIVPIPEGEEIIGSKWISKRRK